MKINKKFLDDIFNKKIKLKNKKDKIKLSMYSEYIPMYDIYTEKIYLIKNENLHNRLINYNYRFINDEVQKWIQNKYKKINDNQMKEFLKNNLDIISNYDLETLEETSSKTLYKYSPELGLSVSICKRKSFHKYISYLKPYYSRDELIKLGKNMGVIKDIEKINLLDKKLHYKICKTISNNDVSRELIKKNNKYIIENKLINLLCYYSFTGSYIINDHLRNNKSLEIDLYKTLLKNKKIFSNSPKLDNDYFLYRFVKDDDFLKNLKIGQKFKDKGFMSATRDPFYSPGLNNEFGLILIKINLPKNKKGVGLFIENFSLFPKEEEFIIFPNTVLKLKSKDDKFKYFHTNDEFQKNINTKYEFDLIELKNISIKKSFDNESSIDIDYDYTDVDIFNLIKNFVKDSNIFNNFILNVNDKDYKFKYQWFDSTGTYNKFYFNKVKEGMLFCIYIDNYPVISIEFGDKMVINYMHKNYFYDKRKELEQDEITNIAITFAKIFKYNNILIFPKYSNFTNLNYKIKDNDLLYSKLYCQDLYDYIKTNSKKYDDKNIEFKLGYWKIDKILNKKIPDEVKNKLSDELKDLIWKELIIEIIENHFYLYDRLEKWLNYYHENLINNFYHVIDVSGYLRNRGEEINFPINFNYIEEKIDSDEFKKI